MITTTQENSTVKFGKCKWCSEEIEYINASQMANHSRWCHLNPSRQNYLNTLTKIRPLQQTVEVKIKIAKGISAAHKAGKYDHINHKTFLGKKHTTETKEKMRCSALASNHRRLKKGVVNYKGVTLDSSWELLLAKKLDEMNINWIRPQPIKWVDKDNKIRNYFPDFYLPDYNLYLDPKNPFAYKVQKDKIEILQISYPNIVFLQSVEEINNWSVS